MGYWVEILDHGDDPGRYTLVRGDGLVVTANENGAVVFTRKARKPTALIVELCREPTIQIVKPSKQANLLKKININLALHESDEHD